MKANLTHSMGGQIDRHKKQSTDGQADIEACRHRWKDCIGLIEGRQVELERQMDGRNKRQTDR